MNTAPAVALASMLFAVILSALIWAGEPTQMRSAPDTPDQSIFIANTAKQRHDAQPCLLGSKSCLDMHPRPFELCLAETNRCDQSYSVEQIQLAEKSSAAAQPGVARDAASPRP